jgi:hypothetical protein
MISEEAVRKSAEKAGLSDPRTVDALIANGFKSQKALDEFLKGVRERVDRGITAAVRKKDNPQEFETRTIPANELSVVRQLLAVTPEEAGVEDVNDAGVAGEG